ncbi:MAG: NERD domain-containing protein [Syntrophomonadaceae bacterium]|nr:NERD domain-containing protein [Syntrophomonadaceae bacterium]
MYEIILLASPILIVIGITIYCIWALKKRRKEKIWTKIRKSGQQGEKKVQTTLKKLEKNDKRYKIYHNVKLGPNLERTNEYDTVIIGPNGIFHLETKNYGGERGGIIDVDKNKKWILHKKNGYSKLIANPISQVNSHEYRLRGFLYRNLGIKNVPTQGIIVLSCDHVKLRFNNKNPPLNIPILHRRDLIPYIKNYNHGKICINSDTIESICEQVELMNSQ